MPLQLSDNKPLELKELTAQWSDGDLEEEEEEESWNEDLDEDLEGEDLKEEEEEEESWDEDLDEGDDW